MSSTRLLLIGAGHVHLEILRRLARERPAGLAVTVVSLEQRHFYSGMTPGYLAGQYRMDDITSDVVGITRRAGAECVIGCAAELDPVGREVRLEDGRALGYDLVSLNIGSLVAGAEEETARHAERIKPLHRAARIKDRLDRLAREGSGPARVAVVGAGAAGVEVACAAASLMDRAGRPREIVLLDRSDRILGGYGARFRRRAEAALDTLGIRRRLGAPEVATGPDGVAVGDGTRVPSDLTIWLTGPEGAPLLAASGLPVCPRGFLWIDATLRSVADSRVFAVGDCGTFAGHPALAKSGVYAVREAPVLWHNLLAAAQGRPLASYRPQRGFLSILNTCDGRALLRYKGLVAWSRWAWRLKDRIDRRFMRKYQRLAA